MKSEILLREYIRESLTRGLYEAEAERQGAGAPGESGTLDLSYGQGIKSSTIRLFKAIVNLVSNLVGLIDIFATTLFNSGKIAVDAISSLFGATPDYDSIITNQRSSLKRIRDYTGEIEKRTTVSEKSNAWSPESNEFSLFLLLEQDEHKLVDETIIVTQDEVGDIVSMFNELKSLTSLSDIAIRVSEKFGIELPQEIMNLTTKEGLSKIEGKDVSEEETSEAGNELLSMVKNKILPEFFNAILSGAEDTVKKDAEDLPEEIANSLLPSISAIYDSAKSKIS